MFRLQRRRRSHPRRALSLPLCACAVPERVSLEKIMKKKKGSGRGSPMEVDGDDAPLRDMDTVYINMTKREDRKKLCLGEMRAQGLTGRRFPAKTGDEVSDALVTREWHSGLNCLYDKKTVAAVHKMSKGERGCSGSHIALWKQCAKRDDPTKPMLILEDDAVLWDRYMLCPTPPAFVFIREARTRDAVPGDSGRRCC